MSSASLLIPVGRQLPLAPLHHGWVSVHAGSDPSWPPNLPSSRVHSSLNWCSGKFFPTWWHWYQFLPIPVSTLFAFFVWAVWMHSLSLDVFSWKLLVIANWSLGFCLYCSYVCWSLWSVPKNYPAHSELQGELDHNWNCSLRVACTDLFDWDQNPVVFNFFLYFYPGFTDSSCCLICLSEASA